MLGYLYEGAPDARNISTACLHERRHGSRTQPAGHRTAERAPWRVFAQVGRIRQGRTDGDRRPQSRHRSPTISGRGCSSSKMYATWRKTRSIVLRRHHRRRARRQALFTQCAGGRARAPRAVEAGTDAAARAVVATNHGSAWHLSQVGIETRGSVEVIDDDPAEKHFSRWTILHLLGDFEDAKDAKLRRRSARSCSISKRRWAKARASFRIGQRGERSLRWTRHERFRFDKLLAIATRELKETPEESLGRRQDERGGDAMGEWAKTKGHHPGLASWSASASPQLRSRLDEFLERQKIVTRRRAKRYGSASGFYAGSVESMWTTGPFEAKPTPSLLPDESDPSWPVRSPGRESARLQPYDAMVDLAFTRSIQVHFPALPAHCARSSRRSEVDPICSASYRGRGKIIAKR